MGFLSSIFGSNTTSASTSSTTNSTTNNTTNVRNFDLSGNPTGGGGGVAVAGNSQAVNLTLSETFTDPGALQAGRDLGLLGIATGADSLNAGLSAFSDAVGLSGNALSANEQTVSRAFAFGDEALSLAGRALDGSLVTQESALDTLGGVSMAPTTDAGIALETVSKWLPASLAIMALAYYLSRKKGRA